MMSDCTAIVVMEMNLNGIEFIRRKVVPSFYLKGHASIAWLVIILNVQTNCKAKNNTNNDAVATSVGKADMAGLVGLRAKVSVVSGLVS